MSDSAPVPTQTFQVADPFQSSGSTLPPGHTSAARLALYASQLLQVACAAGFGSDSNCVGYTVGTQTFVCHNNGG